MNNEQEGKRGNGFADGLVIAAIVLIALNLRPFLAGPGPVISDIIVDTGLSGFGIAGITVLPLAIMGVGSFFTPMLQRALGVRLAVSLGLSALVLGSVLRAVPIEGATILISAAVCGVGVAVLQAIMPAFIRARFANRLTVMISLYSALLLAGGAIGAQFVPVLAEAAGSWRIGLAALALPAALAFIIAGIAFRAERKVKNPKRAAPRLSLSTVLPLIVMFGLLNMSYGSLIAWLAPYFITQGVTKIEAGGLIAVMSVVQALAAIILPVLGAKHADMRSRMFIAIGFQLAGFVSLLVPVLPALLIAILLGVGLGGTFSVMLIIMMQQAKNNAEAVHLSAVVQGGGFLLTAVSPILAVFMIGLRSDYNALWVFHITALLVAALLVFRFAKNKK